MVLLLSVAKSVYLNKMSNNWFKRDAIVQYEKQIKDNYYQHFSTPTVDSREKFFATFPYPYMNGTLHLGHAYTITKAEFICRFQQMLGKNVLFPFAFHGTGMPIAACAQRVEEELEAGMDTNSPEDGTQMDILIKMGVPSDMLVKFTDPYFWLEYFPKKAHQDLLNFGICADFSRSFITTDINPYYDSFVKWQFNHLNKKGLLTFGKKPAIYSIKDGQVCADHDRSEGEGVGIKEYVVIKMEVVTTSCKSLQNCISGDNKNNKLYILVATTRLETMYGLHNLWIHENSFYSLFKNGAPNEYCNEYWIARSSIAKNLSYQLHDFELVDDDIMGHELVGTDVKLEMFGINKASICCRNINPEKGTGIVASVPAHSVFDFKNYILLNGGFEIGGDLVKNMDVVIDCGEENIPNIMFTDLKNGKSIDEVSKKIFRLERKSGKITRGKYADETIDDAREMLKKDIVSGGDGFMYYEPEEMVVSRSGDVCIVAKVDQWFINYGDQQLKKIVNNHINDKLNTFNGQVKNQLINVSDWIGEWPCSRTFGLGTKLLDTEYLIDSLSDSTIYMAYYTVAHLVEKIPIEYLNDNVWNYIFLDDELNTGLEKFKETVDEMKKEFQYWYSMDLRVSGKDLVGNHLTMCLYNHVAIWSMETTETTCAEKYLPKAFFTNGHLLLNGDKMSKSKGNFMTLGEAVKKFGSDATRIALAEAGSGFDDANFTESNAENAILKLTNEREWIICMIASMVNSMVTNMSTSTLSFWDELFINDIKFCIVKTYEEYNAMEYQKAMVEGFYNMLKVRDEYMKRCTVGITTVNYDAIKFYILTHLRLVYPICPCYSEYLWDLCQKELKLDDTMKVNSWPQLQNPPSQKLNWYKDRFNETVGKCRSMYDALIKRYHKNNNICDPKNLTLRIITFNNYSKIELEILAKIKSIDGPKDDQFWKNMISETIKGVSDKRMKGSYAKFINFIKTNCERYNVDWLNFIEDSSDKEVELLNCNLAKLVPEASNIIIERAESNDKSQFNYGPWFPIISLK